MSQPEYERNGLNVLLMGLYTVLRLYYLVVTAAFAIPSVLMLPFYIASIIALFWQVTGWRRQDWEQFNRGYLMETVLVTLRLCVTLVGQGLLQGLKLDALALVGWMGKDVLSSYLILYHPYPLWGLLWLIRYRWKRMDDGESGGFYFP